MKNSNLIAFRVVLILAIIAYGLCYLLLLFPGMQEQDQSLRQEIETLSNEKRGIESAIHDTEDLESEIANLTEELDEIKYSGNIDNTKAKSDIYIIAERIGIEPNEVLLEEPVIVSKSGGMEEQLMSVAISVNFEDTVDNCMTFIDRLESSSNVAYRITDVAARSGNQSIIWTINLKLYYY